MIKITITTVAVVFHQSPFTQERTEVQKGKFSLDMAFTWFCISSKAVDTFSDRSGMYTQHSTLIMAQVPPWAAVSMSNAILFWITAFLIWIYSSFKAWMALVLYKRACLVKLVKASTLTVLPNVRIPEREESRLPRQCNSQKKGKFIADSSQGSRRATNTVVWGQRASLPLL